MKTFLLLGILWPQKGKTYCIGIGEVSGISDPAAQVVICTPPETQSQISHKL